MKFKFLTRITHPVGNLFSSWTRSNAFYFIPLRYKWLTNRGGTRCHFKSLNKPVIISLERNVLHSPAQRTAMRGGWVWVINWLTGRHIVEKRLLEICWVGYRYINAKISNVYNYIVCIHSLYTQSLSSQPFHSYLCAQVERNPLTHFMDEGTANWVLTADFVRIDIFIV